MSRDQIVGGIAATTFIISLLAVVGLLTNFSFQSDKRHEHNKQKLEVVKFEDVYAVQRGFFKDCTFIVDERKAFYVFSGTVTKCPGNPDVIESSVEIDAKDFLDLERND